MCCLTGQYHSAKKRLVQLAVLYGWHYQNKSKFFFFCDNNIILTYPKTYLPWQQSTLVVDSGDSLFLTSRGPLSPTVNSPNNPTTGRINKSSKQDPRVASCCSLVLIKKILKKELKKNILKTLKRKLG